MRKPEKIMLSEAEKTALNEIAGKVGSFARSGPTAGKPSFRVLMQEMAAGTFILFDKRKPRKKKSRKGHVPIPGAPDWWAPWFGNAMGLAEAMKRSSLERAGILALGLRIECNHHLSHPEVVVGKPEWPAPFAPSRPHWWWMPDADHGMDIEEALELSGLTADQIKAGGLTMDEMQFTAPESWKAWQCKEKNRPPVDPPADAVTVEVDEPTPAGDVADFVKSILVSGPPGSEWEDRE